MSESFELAANESVWDYPRPPIVVSSHEHVVIELNGDVVADTCGALRVLETSHPPVYYIPAADIFARIAQPRVRDHVV